MGASEDVTRSRSPHRAGTTRVAVVLMLALTAYFGSAGGRSLAYGLRGEGAEEEIARQLVLLGTGAGDGATALLLIGGVVLVVTAVYVAAGLGVLARRDWGREAAGVLAFVLGAIATISGISGLTSSPRMAAAPEALATGLANLAVVVLLLRRETREDFAAAAQWRQRTPD
jgi:hypothetical protein